MSLPAATCSARCLPPAQRRRCGCTAWTKVVGRCWNTPGYAECRPASGWRTRCGCPTARPPSTTRPWCPRRSSCSVGRGGQCEVGEVETRYHYTTDHARHVVPGPGALPVPRPHDDLRLFSVEGIAATERRCVSRPLASTQRQDHNHLVVL